MAAAEPPPLCRLIREARTRVALISQEEAARRLGLSLKGYRAYETFREPSVRRLRQIAGAFGLDEEHFFRGAGGTIGAVPFERRVDAELQLIRQRLDRLETALAAAASAPAHGRASDA